MGTGGGGTSEFALSRGGGDALCPGADEGQEPAGALTWDPRQVVGVRIPGCLDSLPHAGWGVGNVGSLSVPQARGGSAGRGARTWTPRGDPGPGPRGRGRAPRREALFHFPAPLRFLRSVSLTSLNFTALGLRPPGSAPGRKRVLGSGSLPRPRGGPSRQGAGQARGAQSLQGRPACEPPRPAGPCGKGFWAVPAQRAGFASARPAPPLSQTPGRAAPPSSCSGSVAGRCGGDTAGRGNKSSRDRYQSWGPSRVAKPTPLASVSFPWRRGGALKSRGRVKYRNFWSMMARPGTCLEIKLGAGDEGRRGKRPLAPKGFPQEPERTPYRDHSEGRGGSVALP